MTAPGKHDPPAFRICHTAWKAPFPDAHPNRPVTHICVLNTNHAGDHMCTCSETTPSG